MTGQGVVQQDVGNFFPLEVYSDHYIPNADLFCGRSNGSW